MSEGSSARIPAGSKSGDSTFRYYVLYLEILVVSNTVIFSVLYRHDVQLCSVDYMRPGRYDVGCRTQQCRVVVAQGSGITFSGSNRVQCFPWDRLCEGRRGLELQNLYALNSLPLCLTCRFCGFEQDNVRSRLRSGKGSTGYAPRRVASSRSCVSTASGGSCTYLTTEPRMKQFFTAIYGYAQSPPSARSARHVPCVGGVLRPEP